MGPKITLTDTQDPAVAQAMVKLLMAFNNAGSGWVYDGRPLVVQVSDPETDELLGGVWGSTSYDYLHVDMLFLPEHLRRRGLGTQLLRQAEAEAIRRGCHGSYLDTFDFQATGFYEKLGYSVFGVLEENPPGHTRFFLSRRLL